MAEQMPRTLREVRPMETVDEFTVVERVYSEDPGLPSVGLANIHAEVPDIEGNKDKVFRAAKVFKERRANVAIFPEFCLSGYFWEDEATCWPYMEQAVTENHLDWIEEDLRSLLDDEFRVIVLNNLRRGPDRKFFNTTFVLAHGGVDYDTASYDKVFLPGIEKIYTRSGQDDRLTLESSVGYGRFGFTTCYDYLFTDLLREYAFGDQVDVIVELASWRAAARRDYPGMNIRTDLYYGELWDMVMSASSANNQVWTVACNAVGKHAVSGATFWGGSGIWAPSGLRLVQASHFYEELLVVHNIDLMGGRQRELDDFDYAIDFREIYRPMADGLLYTRSVD